MGRKTRQYTLAELRHLLKGKRWSDFKIRQRRGRKQRRWLCINGVFFGAHVDKGLGPPSLKIKAKGQIAVLKFIPIKTYDYLKANIYDEPRWSHLKDLGPVVGEDSE